MRTWRVGTISMGASLIFLGVLLLLSQFLNWKVAYTITAWWPLLLIVLGVEILLYLYFSKKEKPNITYDFLSIFFVGVVGFVGIGFTIMNGTGIVDKINHWIEFEEKTSDLPAFSETVGDDVKRIVVNTGPHPLTIEGGSVDEISVFGIYRSQVVDGEPALESAEDYLLMKKTGNTLYVTLKGLPNIENPFGSYTEMNATMVVPSNIHLEVIGNYQSLTLKPRNLAGNWSVSEVSDLNLLLAENADITLSAENVEQIEGEKGKWQLANQEATESGEESASQVDQPESRSSTLTVGKGTHKLDVSNTYHLNISLVN